MTSTSPASKIVGQFQSAGLATPIAASDARNADGPSLAPGRPLLRETPVSSGRPMSAIWQPSGLDLMREANLVSGMSGFQWIGVR